MIESEIRIYRKAEADCFPRLQNVVMTMTIAAVSALCPTLQACLSYRSFTFLPANVGDDDNDNDKDSDDDGIDNEDEYRNKAK